MPRLQFDITPKRVLLSAYLILAIDYIFHLKLLLAMTAVYLAFLFNVKYYNRTYKGIHRALVLLSLMFLIGSYLQRGDWFGSLYLEIGASVLFAVLISFLVLRSKDDTTNKINALQKKQVKIERMLKELLLRSKRERRQY
jgi:hypothetical protein